MANPRTRTAVLLALGGLAVVAPVAGAQAGGAPYEQTGGASPQEAGTASGLSSRRGELLGRPLRVRGTLPDAAAGTGVELQRLDPVAGWTTVATATAGEGGAFLAVWRPDHAGRLTLRAVPAGTERGAQAAEAAPTRVVTIFRPALATWYGPGFFGRRTACGQRMTRRLMGVAHRRLPCGTRVSLLYRGRQITVPVVDRGPFRAGTSYDLTAATARALRFTHTDTIGAVRVRRPAP